MTQPEPLLCDVKETAGLLGVSETTVWVLTRGGQIASVKVPSGTGRGRRYTRWSNAPRSSAFTRRTASQQRLTTSERRSPGKDNAAAGPG
jgi:hypothetical protein